MSGLLMKMPVPFEPKRENRFILRFPDELGVHEWYVSSAKRPSAKINSVAIPFINTETYVAGKFTWDPISVTFKDPIGPSAAQALMGWFRLHAESVTGRMGYAAGYKKDIELDLLDPAGVAIEKWILESTFLTSLDFGALDYNSDNITTITCELRMDRCILVY